MKKFNLVNPVIGKLATQVKATKLIDYQLTKKTFGTRRSWEILTAIGCTKIEGK